MSSTAEAGTQSGGLRTFIVRGVAGGVAGLGGGIVFGMLMAMMGMLPKIAMLVGSQSSAVGLVVHLSISVAFGALFGVIWHARRLPSLLIGGAMYGVIWWILGAQLIMPARLGMPVFAMNATAMQSLMGHLIYGLVTGLLLWAFRRKNRTA